MNTNDLPSPPSDFDGYKLIRDEIAHEDNLMSSRVSWFMTSQSFLLTALAIAQGGLHQIPTSRINYFFPLLPIIAIVSDVLILAGVLAGAVVVHRWRHMLDESSPRYDAFPRVRRDHAIIRLGWIAPVGLPVIFLAAWLYLLWAGLSA